MRDVRGLASWSRIIFLCFAFSVIIAGACLVFIRARFTTTIAGNKDGREREREREREMPLTQDSPLSPSLAPVPSTLPVLYRHTHSNLLTK